MHDRSEAQFNAPWGRMLILITSAAVAMLVGMPVAGLIRDAGDRGIWFLSTVAAPLTILLVAVPFAIRKYGVTANALHVYRLGWKSVISLDQLHDVTVDPQAMKRSLRVFGNGGLFCFAGLFRNKRLGPYRAYATKPELAVVLRFTDRVVVVTPEMPDKFAAKLLAVMR